MIKLNNPKFKVITLFISMVIFSFVFIWCITDVIKVPDENNISQPPISSTLSPANTYNELQPNIPRMNVGSSKKLVGKCLFINIFLSDEESSFDVPDKELVLARCKHASDFLYRQIEKYDKELSIIYDYDDLFIDYYVDFIIPTDSNSYLWTHEVLSKIYQENDIDSLVEKYNADNLSFVFNVNKPSRSYAIPNNEMYNSLYDNEIAVLFTDKIDEEGGISPASVTTYPHEILHLFGAIDLYYENPDDEKLAALAEKYFPNEIMGVRPLSIEAEVNNLNAYLIGWVDQVEEKEYLIFLEKYKI